MTVEERVAALRAAATGGDAEAAGQLGRLYCLLAADPDTGDPADELSPAEPWLRRCLDARPGDSLAAVLLASRLTGLAALAAESDDDEHEAELIAQALELHRRALATDPTNAAARAGLGELDDDHGGYAYYLVEVDAGNGSILATESLVATDPDELRWAMDMWLELIGHSAGTFEVTTHDGDRPSRSVLVRHDGERADWGTAPLPALTGEPLPPGHPVRGGDGSTCPYGYGFRFD